MEHTNPLDVEVVGLKRMDQLENLVTNCQMLSTNENKLENEYEWYKLFRCSPRTSKCNRILTIWYVYDATPAVLHDTILTLFVSPCQSLLVAIILNECTTDANNFSPIRKMEGKKVNDGLNQISSRFRKISLAVTEWRSYYTKIKSN